MGDRLGARAYGYVGRLAAGGAVGVAQTGGDIAVVKRVRAEGGVGQTPSTTNAIGLTPWLGRVRAEFSSHSRLAKQSMGRWSAPVT